MINRVVFISVLMILSLTATAGPRFYGKVVADTSVIPVNKTQITERPLAERLETKSPESISKKKTVNTDKMAAGTAAKNTGKPAVVSGEKSTGKAKVSEPKSTGKAKAESEEKNTSWEAAMNEEKSTSKVKVVNGEKSAGKMKVSSGEKSVTKTAIGGKVKSTDKAAIADNEKSAVKGTAVKKDKPAVKIAPEKITKSAVDNRSMATTNKSTGTADATTVKSTSTTTTTTKKATTGSASSKKLAKLTPAEINRVAYTRTINSSKTKASRKLRKGIGIELFQPLAFKYAILLDVPIEKMIDDKLLQVLDYWYGTRYRFGGESRKGIDCSAFTQAFMLNYFEYELPRRAEEQYAKCKHIKKKKLRQGDLVFFKTHGPKGGITHVGVYLVNSRFVHSSSSTGVRISDLNEDYYTEHYAGGGRIR